MSTDVMPKYATPGPRGLAAALLAAWFALVVALGAGGAYVTVPGLLPVPIALAVVAPIALFLLGIGASRPLRDYVLAIDARLMLGIQAWRFAGLGFLALYAHGVLPGMFAWPAGLGDIAIGVTAPWLLVTLTREPRVAASPGYVAWNLLGILDLVVAVGTGAASSALATGAAGEITTGPMARMPLVLIPAFFVPLFVMLHIAALMQARRLARDSA